MEVKNPGLAFNKRVFNRLNASNRANFRADTKTLHEKLMTLPLNQTAYQLLDAAALFGSEIYRTYNNIELTVAWPGMMMGLGYGHGAKTEADNKSHPLETEMKNGFYFDFTTGLPVLPGTSVKGILRSFFPGRYKSNKKLKEAVHNRLSSILQELFPGNDYHSRIAELENTIFEGIDGKDQKGNDIFLPSTKQDIFLDAYPCEGVEAEVFIKNPPESVKIGHEVQKLFLGEDVITPHRHPLKDPVPLKHLKILPGVKMKFQFLLNDLGLPAADKERLFRYLLCLGGVGAKSGVGFGQLTDSETPQSHNPFSGNGYIDFDDLDTSGWEDEMEEGSDLDKKRPKTPTGPIAPPAIQEDSSWPDINTLKSGSTVKGTVIQSANGSMTIQLHIKETKQSVKVQGKEPNKSVLNLKITETSGKPEKGNYKVEKVQMMKK